MLWFGSMAGCNLVFPLSSDPVDARVDGPTDTAADTRSSIPGLVAQYPLDDLSASTTLDVSGSDHHAVCSPVSCPMLISTGRHGGALHFSGSQVLRITSQGTSFDLPAFTIAFWFRIDSIPNSNVSTMVALPLSDLGNNANPWALSVMSNTTQFDTAHADNNPYLLEGGILTTNEWHHVAGIWDGQTKKLAFEGAIVNTIVPASPYIPGPSASGVIGADVNAGQAGFHFTGDLDDIQLFDRALEDAELILLAQ